MDSSRLVGLSTENLSYRYGNSKPWALDSVSCEFTSNAIAVLGPNGAGKTTLFNILSTVLRPSGGSFQVGNLTPSSSRSTLDAYRRSIGVLPQNFRAMGSYSCREVLEYVAWLRQVPSGAAQEQINEALASVDLSDSSAKRVRELSGGTRQRLGLAQALVSRPQLLLLDEPTVGLDPAQRAQFLKLLGDVSVQTTVCLATHLVEDVAIFASEVLLLVDGKAPFAGQLVDFCGGGSEDAIDGPAVQRAYFDRAGITAA